ncbi:unnamed protein product [Paramecium primaurelia]|uniref:CBM20 domain-containing protein n=1 Tax=Paramecium primaurelia TaxID=5886 RepID=A0A8S1K577_PARPR|nr:unnamed protein product [Paramecium primaurelia]
MVKLIEFRIHFTTQFGKAIYLTGNSDILGNWNPNKAKRMNWSEGNIWKVDILLHNFEYKYFVADYDTPSNIIWEPGPNRVMFQNQTQNLKTLDFWNYREVQLYCNNPQNHQIYITGSSFGLTQFKQFKQMNQQNDQATFQFLINPCKEREIKFQCCLNNQEDLKTNIESVSIDNQNQYQYNIIQIKCNQLDVLLRKLEEEYNRHIEEQRKIEQEKIRQEEENKRRIEQEKIRQQYNNNTKKNLKQQEQTIKQHIQPITQQTQIQKQINKQPIKQQIQTLNQEIIQIDNNKNATNNQKQFQKHQYQQQLLTKLKDSGEVKEIPHVKQNIEVSNPEVALYVLKESLLRDQNRELVQTNTQYSFGFDSIIGAYGSDQSCLKVRNTNLDYDTIVNDNQLLEQQLLEFKQKLSISLNISIDQIEILGVSKGSFEISFQITGKNSDEIQQQIKNKPEAQKFLNEYCNGQVEYVAYFDNARTAGGNQAKNSTGVALSSDDFNPQFNMSWDNLPEKEQRGPPYHRYDYYFPRGCYGLGLKVKNYGNDDWIKMDGNANEWRILYHGTKNFAINQIVKNNLVPGGGQAYAGYQCQDEFGNTVPVGNGIYFSDKLSVCQGYTSPVQAGNKKFRVYFMSRVNPKKIRQSNEMKPINYFVVNNSQDVRPYRILIQEEK